MFPGRPRFRRLATVALLLSVLLSSTPLCESQNSIVCNEGRRVSLDSDGNLVYDPLPGSNPPDVEEYDAGGLEGWYSLARGFVDAVQPENLPYDVIESSIEENNLACSVRDSCDEEGLDEGEFDGQATLKDFGEWWAPLITVTVLGGVFAFCFLLAGGIFLCCRCCGACGGGRSKSEPQDVRMFVVTVLLLLVALVLFVGVVLSFVTNERSYDSIDSLQETVNGIIDTAVDYMDDIINDADILICYFIQVTDIALNETDRLNSSLNEVIDEVSVDVDSVLQRLNVLSSGINGTSDILLRVSNTTQELQSQSDALNSSLSNVAANIDALKESCPLAVTECNNIPPGSDFIPGADFNQLPDVTQELTDVENSLEGIDILSSIDEGNAEFNRVTGDIQSEVNSHLSGVDDDTNSSSITRSLSDANDTIFDNRDTVVGDIREVILNNFTSTECPDLYDLQEAEDVEVNVGFIRQCYINQVFEQIQEYDVYRYAFGIIICCLALLTFVLTIVGIVLGVLGWRKDRSPDSRTKISHCGGIILLITVYLTFLFGFVLLILAALAFFFGSNLQKICQAVEPPEYEVFTKIIDNMELWNGSLIGEVVLGSGSVLSISGALRGCERNEALYTAFNLSRLFDVRMEILNTTETFGEIEQELNETINSFNYTSDSFLDNQTRSALNDFTDAGVEAINITAFTVQLQSDLLSFDLDEAVSSLEALIDPLTAAGETGLVADTNNIISQLMAINNTLPSIEMNVDLLSSQVNELSTHIDTVVVNTSTVVEEIDGLVVNLTGPLFRDRIRNIAFTSLNNLKGYITDFLNDTATLIETEVGNCRPLSTIYSEIYDFACQEAVDGLNGYWWSLGFCALCFIPLIILAVCASTHYLRQKTFVDDSYSDYPMKAF